MEKIQIMNVGSTIIESIDIEDSLDVDFKPGLYKQTLAFLTGEDIDLCTLEYQATIVKIYDKIAGY